MKYYHVTQGFSSAEPMLGIYTTDPRKAAAHYFIMLLFMDVEAISPLKDGIMAVSYRTMSDWDDLRFSGCFVEDRQAKKVWHVSAAPGKKLVAHQELPPPKKAKK